MLFKYFALTTIIQVNNVFPAKKAIVETYKMTDELLLIMKNMLISHYLKEEKEKVQTSKNTLDYFHGDKTRMYAT